MNKIVPETVLKPEGKTAQPQYMPGFGNDFETEALPEALPQGRKVVVTVGTLDASLVHPREVFKPAIIEGSSAVILS
ncbi:MAG: JAB domain-containing protein, partial [Pseudomonadota bacterium]